MNNKKNRHSREDLQHPDLAPDSKTNRTTELYTASHQFDGTYANPQWLG